MNVGSMVVSHQRVMKWVAIVDDVAVLRFIDVDGEVHTRYAKASTLAPLWSALGARCCWPEAGHLGLLEERAASFQERAKAKAPRKAKRSNKIKRKAAK